ncbi:MAG: myo-inositol 2-dehydrogenase / D-chiro-inositol 1-dehydrogenase, partial [Solirubrobacteraceae bacterium]|nr:myo-inositol 2-dehydrogenase / D-chiro-inositol 1-dehydrogenase [Solirubrobacteraceae bacterium]
VVASSDTTHQDLVLACLRAERPVLCEKPLAPTAEASLSIVEAEAALGRRLVQVAFMRRFDAGYVAVKERLDRGDVGAALLVHCAHRNATAPDGFTSDMLITSSATHEFDVTRWLLGEEIVGATVHAPRSSRLAAAGVRDPQLVLLETEGGALVDVEVFVNARYGYDIRCEVVGESGTLALAPPAAVEVRHGGHDGHEVDDDFRGRFASAYREQLQAWVDALADGGPEGPSAWDGYAAAAVADACLESLAAGRRAEVRLASRPDLYAGVGRPVAVAR